MNIKFLSTTTAALAMSLSTALSQADDISTGPTLRPTTSLNLLRERCTSMKDTENCREFCQNNRAKCRAAGISDDTVSCWDGLLDVCLTQKDSADCVQCARQNEEFLKNAECTIPVVKAFCQSQGEGIDETSEDHLSDTTNNNLPLPIPSTVLPPGTSQNPLQVIIMAGQSGCVGQASSILLENDDNPSYTNLKGTQEGVWFAGFQGVSQVGPERFYIGPMVAGEASRRREMLFGPEVSIGNRIYEASGSDVLVIKYCWGGSNIFEEWNPRTRENSWDREADDGTAEWLLLEESSQVGIAANLGSKRHLYANLIYTIRKTLETLDEANVVYNLAALFWLQGSADKKVSDWKEYGDDSAALFEAVRADLNAPTLPIVDRGSLYHNINTGKHYASSVIKGCNYIVAETSFAAPNPDDESCLPGAGKVCPDSTFVNYDVFEYFGYDPAPEFADRKPPGATDKIFHWFRKYPTNQHAEYEHSILTGRTMANAYLRSFTNYELSRSGWVLEDIYEQFPFLSCDPNINNGKPNQENICWMDQRDDIAREEATCEEPVWTQSISRDNAISSGRSGNDGLVWLNSLFLLVFVGFVFGTCCFRQRKRKELSTATSGDEENGDNYTAETKGALSTATSGDEDNGDNHTAETKEVLATASGEDEENGDNHTAETMEVEMITPTANCRWI